MKSSFRQNELASKQPLASFAIFLIALVLSFTLAGCNNAESSKEALKTPESVTSTETLEAPTVADAISSLRSEALATDDVEPYGFINDNYPYFTDEDLTQPYGTEIYAPLDALGRAVEAFAIVGPETEPRKGETRGSISNIKPTGWVQAFYKDELNLDHLYERSHLLAWRLTAENDNERNLITGTAYMNSSTMTHFEEIVDNYIDRTGNHVAMRVTPYYEGNNLVASGVQMEAYSLEDNGASICFNVFCFNVQPGVVIDYATGESKLAN